MYALRRPFACPGVALKAQMRFRRLHSTGGQKNLKRHWQ